MLSSGPARVAGLAASKGAIAEGMDADLIVWEVSMGEVRVGCQHETEHLDGVQSSGFPSRLPPTTTGYPPPLMSPPPCPPPPTHTQSQPSHAADTSITGYMHRHKLSPYTDKLLLGKAVMTVASGHVMHLHTAIQVSQGGGDTGERGIVHEYKWARPSAWLKGSTISV